MLKFSLKRLEALFHQTAELAPEQRSRFLDTHCAGDTQLRSAVEELLKYDTGAAASDSFLASPIRRAAERVLDIAPVPVLPTIPGYEVIEELGRGGMGVVYKARQSALNRFVALKMLLSNIASTAESLARFRTEAEALARLQHPHIVQVYDVGELEGRPYFSMEYVAGPNLARQVAGVPQPARSSAQLLEAVARAVDAVHRCGILHRDLKPANILLQRKSEIPNPKSEKAGSAAVSDFGFRISDFEPKVSDFGLAKLVRDQPSDRNVTEPGQALGTPSYMAPEQAWGRAHVLGPATDVYALGAILYELLTGRPPFEGETPTETILQLISQEPVPPTQLRPKLPRDLETICLKCLEKEPTRRYASADALAQDLRRFQTGEPIQARPVSAIERAYRWCRRRPLVAALLAVTISLALALIATVVVYNVRLQRALATSEQYAEDERQQLVQRNVAMGRRSVEAGEAFTALLWFTEALRLDQGDAQREKPHRTRIATALKQCPRLTHLLVSDEPVKGARLSEVGSWIIATNQDCVRVWDVMTGKVAGPALQVDAAVFEATISPDGRFLAAICADNTLRIWDRSSGKTLPRPLLQGVPISKVSFSGGGEILLIRRTDFVIERWDPRTWQPLPLEAQPQGRPRYSTFSDGGNWIFMVDAADAGQEWDAETGKALGDSLKLEPHVVDAALSSNGHRVAVVDRDNQVRIWDLATGKLLCGPLVHPRKATQVVFSPGGNQILTTGDDTVRLWEVGTGQLLAPPLRHEGVVTQAQFSPDGRLVVTGASDNKARVWELPTGQALTPPLEHHGSLVYAVFSPDSQRILTVGRDDTARLWELPGAAERENGRILIEEPGPPPQVVNPGGRQLSRLETGDAVLVIDAVTRMPVGPPLRHRSRIEHAVLSSDGRFVLTASDDNTAQVWDAASGARLNGPCQHKGTVLYASFSPDGHRLITASEDQTARVWDVMTGEPLTPPLRHPRAVLRAHFSPDGEQAITVCADDQVRAWDLTPDNQAVSTLVLLAQVLSGSRIDEKYGVLPLDSNALRSAWQTVQAEKSAAMLSSNR